MIKLSKLSVESWKQAVANSESISKFKIGKEVTTHSGKNYILVEPVGKNFHPDFKPHFTPIEMLQMGVFEGKYLNDCVGEYPREFYEAAKVSLHRSDESVNYFGEKSRQPTSIWNENGWINEQDPRGWFEWYCRYYLGRRTDDDLRQIKRWKAFARHAGQIKANCPGDLSKRRKQRQALLQWSYNPFI